MNIVYVIRNSFDCEMVNCFEGEDGKARAEELVAIHNRLYPSKTWFVSTETI